MNGNITRLCKGANEVKIITHNGSGKDTEYFSVDEQSVTITIKKTTTVPLSKEFECTCKHASLFGTKHNIPCKHIFAVIHWLVENIEVKK